MRALFAKNPYKERRAPVLYQNLLTGVEPYSAHYDVGKDFPPHVHYELEFVYVIEGSVCAVVDGAKYDVNPGEVILVGSMTNHSYINKPDKTTTFIVEFGPVFIGEEYKFITKKSFGARIFRMGDLSGVAECIEEIRKTTDENGQFARLTIKSLLYRLFVLVAENGATEQSIIEAPESAEPVRETMSKVQNALTLVHHRYKEPLSINDAAAACGYGKSVFCKIFKNAVGVGFHQYLNAHRIEIAKYLLSETTTPIDSIADTVGYKDTKTFYRLFKSSLGVSPGEYRKRTK